MGEEQLDLVQPRDVGGCAMQEHVPMLVEEIGDRVGAVADRLSTMQCSSKPAGVAATRSVRNAMELPARVESVTQPVTAPCGR